MCLRISVKKDNPRKTICFLFQCHDGSPSIHKLKHVFCFTRSQKQIRHMLSLHKIVFKEHFPCTTKCKPDYSAEKLQIIIQFNNIILSMDIIGVLNF